MIHFPLAIIPIAVLLDVLGVALRKTPTWDRAAAGAWVLGAVAALGAWLAGREAANHVGVLAGEIEAALNAHADLAQLALFAVGVVALGRVLVAWKLPANVAARVALLLLGAGATALLMTAADRGGALVYRHAVAVQLPDVPACPTCEPVLVDGLADGTVLEVDGRGIWLIGEPVEDVQVAAQIELLDFQGRVGVVHHWGEPPGAFSIDTANGAAVLTARSGELHTGTAVVTDDLVLVTSAIGSHFKGYVDGKMVTHGHTDAEGPGLPGVFLEGTGRVRVVKLDVQAIEENKP